MADRYWRGGAGTWNTTSTTNWSTSSNGSGGASVPTAADNVIFDQAGTYTVTMTGALACLSITVSAGTVTFATGTTPTLAISGGMSLIAGTVWSSTGAITFNSTTSQTITTNAVTINGAITFNGVGGNWSLGSALTTGATLTTTLTAGTITLNGFNLTTGIFSSSNTNTRSIAFGSNNIVLAHTTAAQAVLSMATATGFTNTGTGTTTGGFSTTMSVTRTFTFGTTGGTTSNSPTLYITGGASACTLTTGSWFNKLVFTGSTSAPAATALNLNSLTLSGGVVSYAGLSPTMVGTGTIETAANTTLTNFTINSTSGTTTLSNTTTLSATSTVTLTSGTLDLGGFNLTTGIFSSSNTNTRSITFGANNIVLSHTTAAQTVLNMATATGFTYTSSGTYGSGTGCFRSTMSTTRTFVFGTTGGSTTNAPILYLVSGASVATLTTGSWFKEINFGTTSFTIAATTLNVSSIYSVGSTAVLTALTSNMVSSGSINTSGSIGNIIISTAGVTTTIAGASACNTVSLTLGTLDLNSQILICSSTFTWTGGSLNNIGTLQCTTFTLNGPTFNFTSGTINPSTSFVVTTGGFTLNGGTLGAVPTFTHTAGAVTFNASYATTVTGTYTLTAGTLTLADGVTLSTGIFSSSNANTRSIAFGSASAGNINLTHTTATTVVLSMAIVTAFTYTGPGGFTVASMSNTRTFTYGTTGGSISNAVNLTFTTGASVATLTTAGWFKNLDFGTTSFNPGTTALSIAGALTLSSAGTYTGLTFTPLASATYTFNGASVGAIAFNYSGITITMGSAGGCSTLTMTAGTIDFAGYNFTCSGAATYNSTGTLSNFGTFACTTFTNNGATLSLTSGAINASTSFVQNSGSFTIGGSATIGATPLFTHTAGTVTFNTSQSLAVTGTYTFTAGTLNIDDGVTLSTGIFSSTNTNTRTINFGLTTSPGYIALTHTTAATVVLSMAIVTGLTVNALGKFPLVGQQYIAQNAGGFYSNTTVTKTFTCGTTGGNSTNAPCLTVLGTGATQLPTFTTGSWFGDLNILSLTTMTIAATTLNVNSYISQGYYYSLNTTSMNLNMVGSGVFAGGGGGLDNTFGILGTVTINHAGTTSMLYAVICATTVALTAGTLECRYWANGPFNGYSQFALTGAFTQTGGTWYGNAVYIATCTTYTVNGATVSFDSGSITATTSMVLTSGSFTFNGGTISALPLFTHTAGTIRINNSRTVSLAATGTYTFTAGSLILEDAAVLNTGIFSSSGTGTRSITFGTTATYPALINLTHTTAATTVLSMATVTGLTLTTSYNPAYGIAAGFASDMVNTRTFVFGTTGGTITNSPNLKITGSSTPTITTASWFNVLDFFAAQTFTLPVTSLNLNSIIPGSAYATISLANLTANMRGPGFLDGGSSIGAVVINNSGYVTQVRSNFFPPVYQVFSVNCTTLTITAGTLDGGVQTFTGSCTAGVLTTTGSPTLVPGSVIYSATVGSGPVGSVGIVVSGSGNTWVLENPALSFASATLSTNQSQFYSPSAGITCSGAVTWTGGSLTNFGSTTAYVYGDNKTSLVLTCTTFTLNGPTFDHTLQNGGTINPSTSFVLTAGSYTLNGGVLGAVPLFTQTSGPVTFNYNYSLTTTGTYTQTAGALTLATGVTLATGIFSSTGAGTRSIGFGASIVSGSVALNGTDQYLTVPSSTALTLGTGDFTVEAWINPITVAGGANQFNIITLGSLQIFVSDGNLYFNDLNVQVGGGTVVINQWQHIALTRIGTLVTAYINGVPYIYTASGVNFTAATLYIGNNLGGALAWGYISNFRIVKGVSVYTIAAFTPPTTALTAVTGTQLLVDVASSGAYLTDGSTNNFTLTPTGSVTYNASTPVSTGGSLYFNQSTISYLTLPSSTAFNITGDFTIEAWINPTTILAGNNGILDTRVAGQSSAPWAFYVGGDGLLRFFTGTYYASIYPITANIWTHVAVVRSGSILTFFINGVQSGSTYIGTGAISPGTTSAVIGTKDYGINANFRAINYITNLRFVNGTALYTPNTGSFTPPTSTLASTQSANTNGNPSSAITGTQTSLLLNTVNGASFLTDSSTYNATVTNNGTATSSSRNPFAGYVNLTHTTAATVVLNMAAAGGFTYTGNGGFTVAEMTNTRTFSVASTSGGSTTNAVNLYFTSGASVATLTTAGWINNLDFGFTSFNPGTTTLNINGGLVLSSSGTYTGLTPSFRSDSTLTSNGKTVAALVVNAPTYTLTTNDATSITGALTLTAGGLVAPYNITSGSFLSAGPYARSITGSTTTYTITGAGATAWNFGSTGSVLLNGTTQRLSSPTNAAFTFGTGDLTLECWIYQTATSTGAYKVIFADNVYGGTGGYTLYSYNNALNLWIGGSPQVEIIAPAGTIALNTWTHVAWSRSGSSNRLFIDGTQVGATTTDSTNYTGTASLIGASTLSTLFFPGYMTNIRVVKGVAVYTGNFTVPTKPLLPTQSADTNISAITGSQTSLLLSTPSNSFLTDYSTNAFTVTNVGTATANILSPFAVTSPGITFTSFTLSMTAATAKTFAGGGATYPTLNQGGAGALTISGNNSFGDLTATTRPSTITFTISTTQTFAAFTLSGTAGNLVTINSSTAGTQATLSKNSGTVSVGYLSIRDSAATGGAQWYAGTTSTNVSNNTGWIFAAPGSFNAGGLFFAFF